MLSLLSLALLVLVLGVVIDRLFCFVFGLFLVSLFLIICIELLCYQRFAASVANAIAAKTWSPPVRATGCNWLATRTARPIYHFSGPMAILVQVPTF
jgi:hypothetical protein